MHMPISLKKIFFNVLCCICFLWMEINLDDSGFVFALLQKENVTLVVGLALNV